MQKFVYDIGSTTITPDNNVLYLFMDSLTPIAPRLDV